MAFERSLRGWQRATTVAIVLPALVITAVAVSAADAAAAAAAGRGASQVTVVEGDDMNLIRVERNAARVELLRQLAEQAAPPTVAQRERATRSLVRLVLRRPTYVRPVPGPITQWYGTHPGIDIAPPYGTPVGAAHSGVVTFVGWEDGYGMHVEVAQIDGFVTTYSHLSAWTVRVGQVVIAGQQLGNVGSTGYSTGPHLHFEVHVPGGARMDPAVWLRAHGVQV